MSDHNKCPSSEKEHEKCIFRLSYFHRIQPRYRASCTPVLKSAHRIIHSTTLLKISKCQSMSLDCVTWLWNIEIWNIHGYPGHPIDAVHCYCEVTDCCIIADNIKYSISILSRNGLRFNFKSIWLPIHEFQNFQFSF